MQLLYRPGGKEKPRERSLSDDELRALLASLDEMARSTRTAHVLRILLLTGQRRSVHQKGTGKLKIARELGIGVSTVQRVLAQAAATA